MKAHCNDGFFYERPFMDISSVHKRFVAINEFANTSLIPDYTRQVFYWRNGAIYRAYYEEDIREEEFMYIHFQKRPNFQVFFNPKEVNEFYITAEGFYPKTKEADLQAIEQYNPYPGKDIEDSEFEKYAKEYKRIRMKRFVGNLRAYIHI